MAAVALTAPTPGAGAQTQWGTAGETITAGQVVYLDTATNTYKLADASALATAAAAGFALTASINGGPIKVLTGGNMTTAEELTAGTVYVLSEAGAIAPLADWLVATDYLTVMGVATSTSNLKVPNSGPIVTAYGATV